MCSGLSALDTKLRRSLSTLVWIVIYAFVIYVYKEYIGGLTSWIAKQAAWMQLEHHVQKWKINAVVLQHCSAVATTRSSSTAVMCSVFLMLKFAAHFSNWFGGLYVYKTCGSFIAQVLDKLTERSTCAGSEEETKSSTF